MQPCLGAAEREARVLRELDRLVGAGERPLGEAEAPEGERRPPVAGDGWILAVGGVDRLEPAGAHERHAPLGVLERRIVLALVEERAGGELVRVDEELAGRRRQRQALVHELLGAHVLSTNLVHGREPVERDEQRIRVPESERELAGAAVGALGIRRGPSLDGDQRGAEHELLAELGTVPVGAREARRLLEGGAQVRDGVERSVAAKRLGGRELEVLDRPSGVAAADEVAGELGRDLARPLAVACLEAGADALVQPRPAPCGQARVEHLRVEVVREAIRLADRSVRPARRPRLGDVLPPAGERREPLLHLLLGELEPCGDGRRCELRPRDARRLERRLVVRVELSELLLDQEPEALGRSFSERAGLTVHAPGPVLVDDEPIEHPGVDERLEEEGVPARQRREACGESFRDSAFGKRTRR